MAEQAAFFSSSAPGSASPVRRNRLWLAASSLAPARRWPPCPSDGVELVDLLCDHDNGDQRLVLVAEAAELSLHQRDGLDRGRQRRAAGAPSPPPQPGACRPARRRARSSRRGSARSDRRAALAPRRAARGHRRSCRRPSRQGGSAAQPSGSTRRDRARRWTMARRLLSLPTTRSCSPRGATRRMPRRRPPRRSWGCTRRRGRRARWRGRLSSARTVPRGPLRGDAGAETRACALRPRSRPCAARRPHTHASPARRAVVRRPSRARCAWDRALQLPASGGGR